MATVTKTIARVPEQIPSFASDPVGATLTKVANFVFYHPGIFVMTVTSSGGQALTSMAFSRAAIIGGTHVKVKLDSACNVLDDFLQKVSPATETTIYQLVDGHTFQVLINMDVPGELGLWATDGSGTEVLTIEASVADPKSQRADVNVAPTANQSITGTLTVSGAAGLNGGITVSGSSANDFSGGTGTFKTSSGAGTLSGTTTVAANKNLLCASGTSQLDFSLGTGVTKTTTGVNTWGGVTIRTVGTQAAAGTSVADGTQLTDKDTIIVTGADGTKGVLLPSAVVGRCIALKNNAASILKVYPTGATDVINAIATQTALNMAANTSAIFICQATGQWWTIPLVPS